MVYWRHFLLATASLFLFLWNVNADTSDIIYKPVGYGAIEAGQIANGFYKAGNIALTPIEHVWKQQAYCTIGYDILIKKRLELNVTGRGLIAYSTPQISVAPQTMQTRNFYYLNSAFAAYPFGNPNDIYLKLQVGYFPYKYNPDVRNLGEYIFRTNAYPLIVYSDFDYPKANLLGLRANLQYQLADNFLHLENDFLFHSEQYSMPTQDWSISDIFSASFLDHAVTIGGGASWSNLFSVYQGKYPNAWADGSYYPANLKDKGAFMLRNEAGTDSALFDWQSTKVMARVSFDPKKMFPMSILGENDLKIYGEADFIGLKNYPQFYTDLKNRTLISAGINIPGFKVIDVINGEIEYCADDSSSFSDERFYGNSISPGPSYLSAGTSIGKVPKRDQLRWSVYIKKSVLDGHVSFIAQVARDHSKLNFYYFDKNYMSFIESLPATDNWWWTFKTEFTF